MNSPGFVLIATLLFLFVMTVLALVGVENNLLEDRMSQNTNEKWQAFELAETGLCLGEAEVRGEPLVKIAPIHCQIQLLSQDRCGKKQYLVTSTASYHRAQVKLQSVYEWLTNPRGPTCKKAARRVFWSKKQK